MRFAYADPPYLGQGKLYPEHPDARTWDDLDTHRQLLARLDAEYDGWAYSLSSTTLALILPVAPSCRVAAWVKPFAAFKRNVRIAYTWEPVLFKPGRDSSKLGAPVGRDHLAESITLRRGLTGAKPERFCRWVLDLMGYIEGDTVDDLFPGTGVMGRVVGGGVTTPNLGLASLASPMTDYEPVPTPRWAMPHEPVFFRVRFPVGSGAPENGTIEEDICAFCEIERERHAVLVPLEPAR